MGRAGEEPMVSEPVRCVVLRLRRGIVVTSYELLFPPVSLGIFVVYLQCIYRVYLLFKL